MIDLHTHSKYAQHGEGELKYIVNKAENINLEYLGISEHFSLPKGFVDPAGDSAMKLEDLPSYLQEIEAISKKSKINVLKSVEVDFIPEYLNKIKDSLSKLKLDYVIGSVHFIKNWGFDFSEEVFNQGLSNYDNIDAVYSKYYELIRSMVKTNLFDVVAHLDLPKKFGQYSIGDAGLNKTLDCISNNKIILEINTAGNYKPIKEQYPSKSILKKAFEKNIPITIGSDSHKPDNVGRDIKNSLKLAYSIGYRKLIVFKEKNKLEISI